MKILKEWTSTNGNWGVEIVGELPEGESWQSLMPGELIPLGKKGGIEAFKYNPQKENTYAVTLSDGRAEEGSGAVQICDCYLQSNNSIMLWNASKGAIFESFGYKQRSSHFVAVTKEGLKNVPVGVLLALGLIEPPEGAAPAPEPSPPNNQMLEALKKAGLV